jgi:hypothetical protein
MLLTWIIPNTAQGCKQNSFLMQRTQCQLIFFFFFASLATLRDEYFWLKTMLNFNI